MSKPESNAKLYLYWQTEAIRLLETNNNFFADSYITKGFPDAANTLEKRIIYRANVLARQEKIDLELRNWLSSAKIAIAIIWVLALFSGVGVAAGALAHNQVNLASALIALLGLNTITFLLWLLSFLPISKPSSLLANIWLWLNKKINHNSSRQIAGQAFLSLFIRHRLWPSTIGIVSHSTWLVALCAAALTLLTLLSTQSFTFHWETTLLAPNSFIAITNAIGALPGLLGFPMPSQAAIYASVNNSASTSVIQSEWSVWLIGSIIVWGILPRLIGLIFCLLKLIQGIYKIHLDSNIDGWRQLKHKLMPRHINMGIDKPDLANSNRPLNKPKHNYTFTDGAIIGYELGPDTNWPPIDNAEVLDLGNNSSRTELQQVRQILKDRPNLNILFFCNSDLTPDRGAINWLQEIQSNSASLTILCPAGKHQANWQNILNKNNMTVIDQLQSWPT